MSYVFCIKSCVYGVLNLSIYPSPIFSRGNHKFIFYICELISLSLFLPVPGTRHHSCLLRDSTLVRVDVKPYFQIIFMDYFRVFFVTPISYDQLITGLTSGLTKKPMSWESSLHFLGVPRQGLLVLSQTTASLQRCFGSRYCFPFMHCNLVM